MFKGNFLIMIDISLPPTANYLQFLKESPKISIKVSKIIFFHKHCYRVIPKDIFVIFTDNICLHPHYMRI